ncbi:hypothetical protein TBLA_0C06630 [Henningerozyma blattae CBS 6284]|uniref:Uncharacterized protein n=1 Tax=Henningerozyma blattae (strain ATCC 34711 / CBS 6284 / DSM 70876 / NBRC 10599 / NRRL Y-10934 / UCD 77-7) TaxID=1071380 RepID=I2H254_HENB6|nr:hypothetical protein TBLA_0C06630 [Tetrapisispora blattae CBS 6284]CCH60456.1 hypothetical protein TBLA_0C06630 [Tetrapisispora blattae CBS 6284]
MNKVCLYRISGKSEFDQWTKLFRQFPKHQGLGHIIITPETHTIQVSNEEKDYVLRKFNIYVPAKAYPTWFQNELNKGFMSLYDIVECTLSKDIRTDHEIYEEFLDSLYNISFDTKMDATIFRSTTLGASNKAKELDIAINDDWIARRILKSSKGQYASINSENLESCWFISASTIQRRSC